MADKSNQLVLRALHRAVGEDDGVPLLVGRSSAGLFSSSASGKKAAQFSKDLGYFCTLRTETKGRTKREICAITEKGLAFLLANVPPRDVIESLLCVLVKHLEDRQAAGGLEDCPLTELYQSALKTCSPLTIGQFHDALRELHQREQIYLHPWTGPLYEIPEPALALLIGHEIAYYASTRR